MSTLGWITIMGLLVVLTIPLRVIAQHNAQGKSAAHDHYKLVDLGTLGGPASYVNFNTDILNNRGTVVESPIAAAGLFSLKRTCLPPHYLSSGWLAEEFITQPTFATEVPDLLGRGGEK
jgi:hypothetical protein